MIKYITNYQEKDKLFKTSSGTTDKLEKKTASYHKTHTKSILNGLKIQR